MAERYILAVIFPDLPRSVEDHVCFVDVGLLFLPYVIDPKSDLIRSDFTLSLGKRSPSMHEDMKTTSELNKHVGLFSMPCAIRASLPADNLPPNTIEKPPYLPHATFSFAPEPERTPSTIRQPTTP
jgi:hypothetical protein